MKITDISIDGMPNEPERKEGRVVAEITVDEGAYARRFRLGICLGLMLTEIHLDRYDEPTGCYPRRMFHVSR